MSRTPLLPLALMVTIHACTSSDDGTDTDTHTLADTDEASDTDGPADTDVPPDTDVPDDTDPPVTLYREGFEAPALSEASYDGLTPPGLTFTTGDGSGVVGRFRPGATSLTDVEPLVAPAAGTHCVAISGGNTNGSAADARHVLTASSATATLTGGQTYTLTAAVAGRLDVATSVAWIALVDDAGEVYASETVNLQVGHTSGSWTPLSLAWNAPADVDGDEVFVQFGIDHAEGAGVASIVVDEVELVED